MLDELRLNVFPVVLGTGKRLFGETSNKKPMRLVSSRILAAGIAYLVYQPISNIKVAGVGNAA